MGAWRSRVGRDLPRKARCRYCGFPATTWDHVVPKSQGGTNRRENLAPACQPCNNVKGSATAESFMLWLSEGGARWAAMQPHERCLRLGKRLFYGEPPEEIVATAIRPPTLSRAARERIYPPAHGWTPEALEALEATRRDAEGGERFRSAEPAVEQPEADAGGAEPDEPEPLRGPEP